MAKNYTASDIAVLEGLEPVKLRPGMYTRTDSPTHIVQEVIDNAVDEALAGFSTELSVTLYNDGSAEVSDNGRGIPVDIHPEKKVPAIVLIFTHLHSGGKFKKSDSDSPYRFTGGLHGVGVSVTNALSLKLECKVKKSGKEYLIIFENGDVTTPLKVINKSVPTSGTSVRCWPDPKYFDSAKISVPEIEHILKSKAVFLPGIKIILKQEQEDGSFKETTWSYENGIKQYLEELLESDPLIPIIEDDKVVTSEDEFSKGEGALWAFTFAETGSVAESYVNQIATIEGGTHATGIKAGIFEALKSFAEHHELLPRGVKLQQDDVASKLQFVLSAKILNPQFQGQVKDKLTNRDAFKLVSSLVHQSFEIWLNSNPAQGKIVADLVIKQALSRLKSTKIVERKKGSGVAVLPGKLTDCESQDIRHNELFIVEGDSAGGSSKMGRNKETQAVLPLRGKIKNTWEVDKAHLFNNKEVHDLSVAMGISPHKIGDTVDLSTLRYGKIIINTDADVDGSHIQTLLATLFLKHFPCLIETGHVFVAQPPLYRLDIPAQGKKPARKVYALDAAELESVKRQAIKDGAKEHLITVGRFKGLGEMEPEELWESTMAPETRKLIKLMLPADQIKATLEMFEMLMAQSESGARREWMAKKGNEAELDI